MPENPMFDLSTERVRLCTRVREHLAAEAAYLERVRKCVLDWPTALIPSLRMNVVSTQIFELNEAQLGLWQAREALFGELRQAFAAPDVVRLTAFPWNNDERDQLAVGLSRVRQSVARLTGAVRASSRTLSAWSDAVAQLLVGLTGQDPRAARYTSQARRAI